MTRRPCSRACGTHSRDCSWGVARKRSWTPRDCEEIPGEGLDGECACAEAGAVVVHELRMDGGERLGRAVRPAEEERSGAGERGMTEEETRQLHAGVAGDAHDGGLKQGAGYRTQGSGSRCVAVVEFEVGEDIFRKTCLTRLLRVDSFSRSFF